MHYLFLLHGMGQQGHGWAVDHIELIENLAAEYSGQSVKTLQKRVEIVELEYDTLLDGIMTRLLEDGEGLGSFNENLKNAKEGSLEEFIRKSALDVTGYIWHSDTCINVLNKLAIDLLSVIAPDPLKNQFSILCHSLGTKVGFDLLHLLYAEELSSNGNQSDVELFKLRSNWDPVATSPRFQNLYLVANVMPLLNLVDLQTFSASDSHVRARINDIPYQGGILNNYRIFNNHYDPIARMGRTSHIPENVYTEEIVLAQAHKLNMHSLEEYLAHPRVHIPIIEDVYGIDVENKGALISEYLLAHKDSKIEIALDTALSVLPELSSTNPPALLDYFGSLAELFVDIQSGG